MPRTKRVGEITITPEYGNLMRQFAGDALIHASVLERMEPEVIHAFRNFVVSLNIALQCATNGPDILFLREQVTGLMERVVRADENHQAGVR